MKEVYKLLELLSAALVMLAGALITLCGIGIAGLSVSFNGSSDPVVIDVIRLVDITAGVLIFIYPLIPKVR